MPDIAVIDYGMGNLRSVAKALAHVAPDRQVVVTSDAEVIRSARRVVLPGQSAMPDCMEGLNDSGLRSTVLEVASDRPFLGICLGMQLLFEESDEFGPVRGLGVLPGRVVRFAADPARKVPHMGWNALSVRQHAPHLAGIESGASVYFVHSYYAVPADATVVATTTPYGVEFASSVVRDNIFACQFHPEKSQRVGLRLLENFAAFVRRRPAG